jgi:hypothetical protein
MDKQEKLLAHLRVTNEIAKRAQDMIEKSAAEKTAAESLIPEVIDALVTNERIRDDQREVVREKLAGDPMAALELLREVAKHRNAAEIGAIGTPVSTKAASARRASDAPVADYDETPGGQAFKSRLLGA